MRTVILLLFLTIEISCAQKKTNVVNNENLSKNKMSNIGECIVPDELNSFIDSSTVFAMAGIARNKVDYLANSLFLLNDSGTFIRLKNKELPGGELLFSNNRDEYRAMIPEAKFNRFVQYLDSVNTQQLPVEYKTPDNLKVDDGALNFVYIRTKNSEKWLCFEPESDSLIVEISKNFDQLFE